MDDRNVLFVDDEINILNALRRGLMDEDYNCFYANSSEEAIRIMGENDIHVIVTDMKMPQMDGLELLKYVKEKYPETIKIVLSGYAQLPQIVATINHVDIFKFILKPWKLEDELMVAINEAIKAYNLKLESFKLKEELQKKNELYQSILKSTGEKFDRIKSDFDSVKKVDSFKNNYIKEIVKNMESKESHKTILLNEISLLEEIVNEYLNSLPSQLKEFNIEKIYKEVNGYISNLDEKKTTELHMGQGSDLTFYGNYDLITLIIRLFIKYTLKNIDFKLLKLSFLGKENNEKVEFLVFAEIVEGENEFNDKLVQAKLNKIITILQNLIELINGKIILREKENLYVTILKVDCYNRGR